jgi:transcriptional regulator with XRE-family HTH domain
MSLARQGIAAKFNDKAYRDAFVAEQIFSRLPMKIRCIREEQELTQKQLGDRAGMAQTWISKLEDPNYGKLTISTLLKIASAFDVGLQIDFVPFSRILGDSLRISADSFVVANFEHDAGFANQGVVASSMSRLPQATMGTLVAFPSCTASALTVTGDVRVPPRSASSIAQQQIVTA